MIHLASSFSVDLWAYAVMDNHFHQVVQYFPKACESWSDEEVAARWFHAFPPPERKKLSCDENVRRSTQWLLEQPEELARRRQRLGSLSAFMQALKRPIARRANLEDQCTGRFFEQRFYSGALLDESAVIAAMAYVDLNPVRAEIVERIEDCEYISFGHRLNVVNNSPERLQQALAPLVSGVAPERQLLVVPDVLTPYASAHDTHDREDSSRTATETSVVEGEDTPPPGCPDLYEDASDGKPAGRRVGPEESPIGGGSRERARASGRPHPYLGVGARAFQELVHTLANAEQGASPRRGKEAVSRWQTRMAALGRRRRAYGDESVLRQWSEARAFRLDRKAWPG